VDSASEKDEDYDEYEDDWEGFWENLGNGNTSDSDMFEESSTSSYMTTEKNDWTEDDYDYEDEYSEEAAAGKDMMESAHHFDSNLGVFAGAKVYHKQTTSRPSSNIRQYDDEEDSSFMSSYTLILLLSTVGIIFLVVVFMHKHKLEHYMSMIGLRRRPSHQGNNHSHRGSSEYKLLMENEYA